MGDIGFLNRLTVAVQRSVGHPDRIARDSYDPFDKVDRRVDGPFEDDHVTPTGVTERREMDMGEWYFRPEPCFVNDQKISYQERTLHTGRRDLEHLE
jgi:hypothetical protein